MRHRILVAAAIISLVFSNSSIALEEEPGDACTAAEENFTIQVGGPETTGVLRFLRCNGTNWENYITLKDDQVSIGIGAATADSVGLVAIGQNAGKGITSPNTYGSLAIGYRALGGDSSSPANGNRNVAIGGDAMGRWSSGQNNTAVGADVAFYCLGGSDNTFVGARIGDSGCPSLSDNTVIGSSSAHMANSAIGNVLIGSGVGNAVDNQILSGNILIGYNIEPQTSPSASNELNIGNALFGDLTGAASNGAGTARIGINSNAPAATAALDVSGTNLGFLPPRNTDPNTNITSPAPGLIAYDVTDNALQYFNGTTWVSLTGGAASGGDGLPAASPGQFCSVTGSFGTNDNQLLICDGFQWVEFMKVENTGRSSVQIAQDTGACIPDKIGRLRYTNSEPPFEYCDGGPDWKPLTVPSLPEPGQPPENWILAFVTDETYTGNLGGLDGADNKCQNAASDAGLPGTYAAWLAGADGVAGPPPATRFSFTGTSTPIRMPDGTLLANSWADLTDGTLQNWFNVNQFGDRVDAFSKVWTNVKADGTAESGCNFGALTQGQSCAGIVYLGDRSGIRLYGRQAGALAGTYQWSTATSQTLANNTTDGVFNTDKILEWRDSDENTDNISFPAAEACRALGPHWYLGATMENYWIFYDKNRIPNVDWGPASMPWSSSENPGNAWTRAFTYHTSTSTSYSKVKTEFREVYCLTREPEKIGSCGGVLTPWTEAIAIGETNNRGWVSSTTSQWTTGGVSSTCAAQNRLYCFQQSGTLTSGVIGTMRSIKMHLNDIAPFACQTNSHGRLALNSAGNMCVCRPTGSWTYLHNTNGCVW